MRSPHHSSSRPSDAPASRRARTHHEAFQYYQDRTRHPAIHTHGFAHPPAGELPNEVRLLASLSLRQSARLLSLRKRRLE